MKVTEILVMPRTSNEIGSLASSSSGWRDGMLTVPFPPFSDVIFQLEKRMGLGMLLLGRILVLLRMRMSEMYSMRISDNSMASHEMLCYEFTNSRVRCSARSCCIP